MQPFFDMKVFTDNFSLQTQGKGTYEITDEVSRVVGSSGVEKGVATVFVCHTSCSLVVMENADPSARTDLDAFFDQLVPEDTPYFVHTYEGPDDMPSHIRMCLTDVDKNIPVLSGRLALGTWQGLFLFEHRRAPHNRHIAVTVMGE
jgi:secondary thiamine-phosphate synthase enzyme